MAISILTGSFSVWIRRMIWFLSVANYVNKAVSTLVMIIYEQDYRDTALSMKAGKISWKKQLKNEDQYIIIIIS